MVITRVVLQLTQRYRDTLGHVIISTKGLPALPGSLTSVNESYSRETHFCVLASEVFINASF